jgi:DNA-binding transcriptional ArsR family regulator
MSSAAMASLGTASLGTPKLGAAQQLSVRLTIDRPRHIVKLMLNQTAELDRVFQALADPSRRMMVERLTRGPASVSELARPLPMTLSAVVQHLAVLEESGLIRSQKAGRIRMCQVEPAALRTAEQWINERRRSWERRLDRLGDYLAEQSEQAKGAKS